MIMIYLESVLYYKLHNKTTKTGLMHRIFKEYLSCDALIIALVFEI